MTSKMLSLSLVGSSKHNFHSNFPTVNDLWESEICIFWGSTGGAVHWFALECRRTSLGIQARHAVEPASALIFFAKWQRPSLSDMPSGVYQTYTLPCKA
jgi:hypothetical protein